jgi:hypothetical protein
MTDTPGNYSNNPSRRAVVGMGSALLGTNFLSPGAAFPAKAALAQLSLPDKAPQTPPPGYNILFVLVDQEHLFEKWPFPVPGREHLKKKPRCVAGVFVGALRHLHGSTHSAYGRFRQHGGSLATRHVH